MTGQSDQTGDNRKPAGAMAAAPDRRTGFPEVLAARADDEISLLDVLQVVRRYRRMILALCALGVIVPAITGVLMSPVYRAHVLVAPVTGEQERSRMMAPMAELGGIAALAGIDLKHDGRKEEAVALLRSRLLAEQLIRDEKLQFILTGENPAADGADPDTTGGAGLADAYEVFDEQVRKVEEDRKTGLVVVAIEWTDPGMAAHWATDLVRRVNVLLRDRATAESQSAIRYLKEQLKQTSEVELQKVLHRLVESEMKQIILANINEEFAFRVIDPAVVPEKAYKPRILLMTALGGVAGLIAGLIAAFFLYAVRSGASGRV